jgi:hypothetical protein
MVLTKSAKAGIAGGVLVLCLAGVGTALAVSASGNADVLTGPIADRARAVAVAAVPGGQPGQVRAESDGAAAYGVEVTKPDGTRLTVHLDRNFAVLGAQPAGQGIDGDGPDGDGD